MKTPNMKSILSLTVSLGLALAGLDAQTYLGIGAGFANTPSTLFNTEDVGGTEKSGPAAQARLRIPIKNRYALAFDGSYFLDKIKYAHYWAVNANFTLTIFRRPSILVYGLAGANAYWVTVPNIVNTPLIGPNIGGGAFYDLKPLSLFVEYRQTPIGKAKHRMLSVGIAKHFGQYDDGWQ